MIMRSRPGLTAERLVKRVDGEVLSPDHPLYDKARTVFYGGFDRRPSAIVRAANATDVSRVVEFAGESGLELAVRSGGHSQAGHSVSEGGLVLDLSSMRALEMDAEGHTAWVQTGLCTGEYTAAVGAHGLATGPDSATAAPWGSAGSRWAAASATSCASTA